MVSTTYRVKIRGTEPLIMRGTAGMEDSNPGTIELNRLTKKRGTNRTDADTARIRNLEAALALWLDDDHKITLSPAAIRTCIESAARTLRQGKQVRSGLYISREVEFEHDVPGDTYMEVAGNAAFQTTVRVGQSRVMRTRPKFDKWAATFTVEVDDADVDRAQLEHWLRIAGRKVGLGDWRVEKSGFYGTFKLESIEVI